MHPHTHDSCTRACNKVPCLVMSVTVTTFNYTLFISITWLCRQIRPHPYEKQVKNTTITTTMTTITASTVGLNCLTSLPEANPGPAKVYQRTSGITGTTFLQACQCQSLNQQWQGKNKLLYQNGDILVLAYPSCPGKWWINNPGKPVLECLHSGFSWTWWRWWWQLEL